MLSGREIPDLLPPYQASNRYSPHLPWRSGPEAAIREGSKALKARRYSVDAFIEEAQASGEAAEMTDHDWAEVERAGLTLMRTRKKA